MTKLTKGGLDKEGPVTILRQRISGLVLTEHLSVNCPDEASLYRKPLQAAPLHLQLKDKRREPAFPAAHVEPLRARTKVHVGH